MSGRQSAAMVNALAILARGGVTVTEAARLAGVNRASLYRARPAPVAVVEKKRK
jgi:hypothetical protein